MTRLRHLVDQIATVGSDGPLPFVALEHLESGTGGFAADAAIEDKEADPAGMVQFSSGDVMFGKLRPYLRKSWLADRSGLCSSELIVMRPRPGMADSRWLAYAVQTQPFVDWAVASSEGVKMPRTSWEKLRLYELDPPSVVGQRAIADYLDAETSPIERVCAARTALLDRLLERRSSTTAHGVAGASVKAQRKAASLPWLWSIPRHWDVVKLTHVARLGSGHTPSRDHPEWWTDCNIPWITTGEVWQLRDDRLEFLLETRESISQPGLVNSSAELNPAGTVVLCRTAASAGYSAVMGTDMATSQDFMTWQCGPRLRPRFLLLCLRAMRQDLLGRLAMGSTHKTIYVPDIQTIRVPLPPVDEQDQLVEWVWERLRAIDIAVVAVNQQIELLQERRQALITAAVTGQIEIRGVAA